MKMGAYRWYLAVHEGVRSHVQFAALVKMGILHVSVPYVVHHQ